METRVQKWGNSLALRIPKAFAAELGLEADAAVDISVEDGQLILRPQRSSEVKLSSLLKGENKKNLHTAVDSGPAIGREVW